MPGPNQAEIETALRRVHDPCSLATPTPIDIVDMGLVRSWTYADTTVEVVMCVTTLSCTMAPQMIDAAKAELFALDGVEEVNVELDRTVNWSEEMIAPEARARLEARRLEIRKSVRPQQWRERVGAAAPAGRASLPREGAADAHR